jgi:hypothetical protein
VQSSQNSSERNIESLIILMKNGSTILMAVVGSQNATRAKMLLDMGADINIKSDVRTTCILIGEYVVDSSFA